MYIISTEINISIEVYINKCTLYSTKQTHIITSASRCMAHWMLLNLFCGSLFIFNGNEALSNNIMCAHHINGCQLAVITSCSFVAAYADPIQIRSLSSFSKMSRVNTCFVVRINFMEPLTVQMKFAILTLVRPRRRKVSKYSRNRWPLLF